VLQERSVVEQRYQAVMEVLDGMPVTEVAERYGVSRQSVHAWVRRYRTGGLAALADRSHRPASCPHQLTTRVEALICELRRHHPGWGPVRLRHELERGQVTPLPSLSGIYRALVRRGLVEPGGRRRRQDYRRWERGRAMQLWQLDVMGDVRLADGTECKLVTGIDDHSRFCVLAALCEQATARAVCAAFAVALGRYGVPDEVLTDNGKQFTGRFGKPRPAEVLFERICRENGITPLHTKVKSPTTTGKVERFHKTVRAELLATTPPFPSLAVAQQVLDAWVDDYNHRRPHQALGMATPAERFGRVQVSAYTFTCRLAYGLTCRSVRASCRVRLS
jgi:transposase InsO family protein